MLDVNPQRNLSDNALEGPIRKALKEGKVKRKQVVDIKQIPYINTGKLWTKIKTGPKTHKTTDIFGTATIIL